jgi:predicted transcriptional regulator
MSKRFAVDKTNQLSGISQQHRSELLQCTSNIVSAYLNKNETDLHQLPQVMETVYSILSSLGEASASHPRALIKLDQRVAIANPSQSHFPVEKSVTSDYIVCLEDGVRLKTLKRYLFRKYQLTPDQYRSKWGLAPDYPMVAPNYAAKRSALAKKMGLGKKRHVSKPSRASRRKQSQTSA